MSQRPQARAARRSRTKARQRSSPTPAPQAGAADSRTEGFEPPFRWGMVYLLARAFYAVHERTEQALKGENLTPLQFTILASVGRWKGLSSAELSRRFRVTPQTMGEMIGNLERRGLVARVADPANRRALKLELTAKGEQLSEAGHSRMRELELELFGAFSPQELNELREHLGALHQHLGLTPT